jgi:hypothetical protein
LRKEVEASPWHHYLLAINFLTNSA